MEWKKSGFGIKDKHFLGLFFESKAKNGIFLRELLRMASCWLKYHDNT